ncbi:MAG: HK97 gp10 family phage protein, partial [Marivivens sp.]|nr:HK97 gp10 family phage protein [Marivivens sp.]
MTHSMQELGRIGKEVRRRARISLKARGKVVTGNLYNSIRYEQSVSKDDKSLNLGFSFPGAEYWQFVDEGVKGALSAAKAPRSPFRFGSGSGPSGRLRPAIDKWVVKKGIAPRGAGGQFASRKSMVYAISRSIYQTGIRPSYFFTNAYDKTI